MMKIKWVLFLAGLVALPVSAQHETSHRIAYVNVPWILNNSPQVKAVEAQLKETFIEREQSLLERQRELDELEDRLRESRGSMSDAEVRQLERDLVSGKRRLAIAEEEFQEDVALRKSEEISKLRRQIAEVIQSVAREKQLDMVFETAVVYVSDRVDISQDVLASLEGQSGQAGAAGASSSGAGE